MAYAKARFPITNGAWSPISVARRVAAWGLKSASGTTFLLRSDPNSSLTEDSVAGSNQEVSSAGPSGFAGNEVLIYAQSSIASDVLVLSYVTEF